MVPLAQAVEANFRLSTPADLREYCKELGISCGPRSKEDSLRKSLLQHFGKLTEFEGPKVTEMRNVRKRSSVIPPYNFILERGLWGGRRHIVVFHRPPGVSDKCGGHIPGVNSGVFPIRWGETMCIPEPFLEAMRNAVSGVGKVVTTRDEYDLPIQHTETGVENRFYMDYKGVDPETKDRPGSLVEYYNSLGVEWFKKLEPAQVRELCTYIEKPTKLQAKDGTQGADIDPDLLRQQLIEMFFPQSIHEDDDHEQAA